MHRKFITLIVSAAVAVTGLTAPARADSNDLARALAGIAALAIIGKVISDSRDDDRVVTHPGYPTYGYTPPRYQPVRPYPVRPQPVQPQFGKYDLPGHCLRVYNSRGQKVRLYGAHCLRNNYRYSASLPYACQYQFSNRSGTYTGYEPLCLRERGYRVARN